MRRAGVHETHHSHPEGRDTVEMKRLRLRGRLGREKEKAGERVCQAGLIH
jgi:hypothetical protein